MSCFDHSPHRVHGKQTRVFGIWIAREFALLGNVFSILVIDDNPALHRDTQKIFARVEAISPITEAFRCDWHAVCGNSINDFCTSRAVTPPRILATRSRVVRIGTKERHFLVTGAGRKLRRLTIWASYVGSLPHDLIVTSGTEEALPTVRKQPASE